MACRYKRGQNVRLNKSKIFGGKTITQGTNGEVISVQPTFGNYYIKFVVLNGPVLVLDQDLV